MTKKGAGSADAALRTRFEAARNRAITEMEGYAAWLERDVVPTARGDFRLGRSVFERKVKYEEFVDLLAQRRGEDVSEEVERALEWLREHRNEMAVRTRQEVAQSLAGRAISPVLFTFFAADVPSIAAPRVSGARLSPEVISGTRSGRPAAQAYPCAVRPVPLRGLERL